MFKRLFSTALIFGAAALAPPLTLPAEAQQTVPCMPRERLVETLSEKYGERAAGGGLQSSQRLIEVWASPEKRTFTVFVTRADGLACVVATGQHWTQADSLAPPEGVTG